MKRLLVSFAVLALLALPVMAWAEDTMIPPELNWTATPPARETVEAAQLMELLVNKGVITPLEQTRLTRPHSAMPGGESGDTIPGPDKSYVTKP
jgi:hypothetical protein